MGFLGWWSDMLHRLGRNPTPQELVAQAVASQFPHEKMQVSKRQTAFTYSDGPMFYLGQQIVKAMEDAGYPAKIVECWRSPERQSKMLEGGSSRAGPWHSPHQYFEAVDIIHPSKGWDVSPEYWRTLSACVRIVAEKFKVELEHGHNWRFVDSAHIELKDWRKVKTKRKPTSADLWRRFQEVLPSEAERILRDGRAPRVSE